jgi:hypothetical protein
MIKKILQHSYKSFNTNFLDQHDIKVALNKYFEQNSIFQSFNMVFGSFYYNTP